jgi:MinD-like ATPase involved in chromosome partitioning or flagellar assembly
MAYDDRPGDRDEDERGLTGEVPVPPADPWAEQHLARGVAHVQTPPPDQPVQQQFPATPDPQHFPATPGFAYAPQPGAAPQQPYLPPQKPSAEPAIPPAPAFVPRPVDATSAFPAYRDPDGDPDGDTVADPDTAPTYHAQTPRQAPPAAPQGPPPATPRFPGPPAAAPSPETAAPPTWPQYSVPTTPAPTTPAPGAASTPAPATRPTSPPPIGAQQFAPPPTAADFAARRVHTPQQPPAVMGLQGLVRRLSFGKVAPAPSHRELEHRQAVAAVRRNFGGLRQITVVNPKGGAGKTVAVLMTAMTFGQQRGGYVLSWDNNETQGTLGMRAQQDFHHRTVRDLLAELGTFAGDAGRVGDLSRYVRSQGEAMFDVLASDESATAGEMLTAQAFRNLREVVSRFYKLIVVDTGNNVRAENWQSAIEATDQLVVPMSARGDSAETAARMLDHLDQTGRSELVRRAVSVISMPASTKGTDIPAIRNHFAARTRVVLTAPYEVLLDSGEPIRYGEISTKSQEAWLKIAASIAEGL